MRALSLFAVVSALMFSLVVVRPAAAQQTEPVTSVELSGRVVDAFGLPVEGVLLQLVSSSGYRREATTGSAGVYRVEQLVPAFYSLVFVASGYVNHTVELDLAARSLFTLNVSLEAVRVSSLVGRVLDEQGLALPGVALGVNAPDGAFREIVTGADGAYRVSPARPGLWSVAASLSGFGATSAEVDVVFGRTATLDLVLDLDYGVVESVVVVGTRRAEGRPTVTDSPVPIDVITGEELRSQPVSDMAELVRALAPSFNVNTQPISDAATVVRPVNFRNLAPDHMLVLVNGKRRHRAAVIAWLGNGLSDGSQGPDVSVIPAIAIRQVELLKDGAAAQYGSDAISGVLNFQLKDARQGSSFEIRQGMYADRNAGDPSTCGVVGASCAAIGNRAGSYSVAGNTGLPLGDSGFLNLSMEYGEREPTNRSVQRTDAAALVAAGGPVPRDSAQVWGSADVADDLKFFANMGTTLSSGLQPYAHANYASRTVTGGFYYRNPHTRSGVFRGPEVDGGSTLLVGDRSWAATGVPGAGGCPAVPVVDSRPDPVTLAAVEALPQCFTLYSRFPGGFTPQFGGMLTDQSLVGGFRRVLPSGLVWDASASVGRSYIRQFINDTVNASLGYLTPTDFDPGSYLQQETNFNFDVALPVGDRLHLAAGAERRTERFTIGAGDDGSWVIGPYAEQGFSSGSNGFNGYRADTTAGSWARSSMAIYADAELGGLQDAWTLGSALRFEHFDDFGGTLNGKLAFRRVLTSDLSLRAAISTGFRAPTPGQQNTFNVTTAFIDGQLTNNGVVPSTSGVALARGGRPLQPETSRNVSTGLVFDRGRMQLSADFFRVDLADRLGLSREIRLRSDEIDVLLSEGIAEARNFPVFRFFLNDFSTTTQGVDVVWSLRAGPNWLRAGWNHTGTRVRDVRNSVINDFRLATLERGLPQDRWTVTASHDRARWRVMGRVNWYGSYWDSEDARNASDLGVVALPVLYPDYGGKALVDAELGIRLGSGAWLSLGAQNVLNAYPDVNPYAADTVGNPYGQFSPFGFDGAYYYARMSFDWAGR